MVIQIHRGKPERPEEVITHAFMIQTYSGSNSYLVSLFLGYMSLRFVNILVHKSPSDRRSCSRCFFDEYEVLDMQHSLPYNPSRLIRIK